jgi:hypothetical protein
MSMGLGRFVALFVCGSFYFVVVPLLSDAHIYRKPPFFRYIFLVVCLFGGFGYSYLFRVSVIC